MYRSRLLSQRGGASLEPFPLDYTKDTDSLLAGLPVVLRNKSVFAFWPRLFLNFRLWVCQRRRAEGLQVREGTNAGERMGFLGLG